jgi:hypothetical protein
LGLISQALHERVNEELGCMVTVVGEHVEGCGRNRVNLSARPYSGIKTPAS